MKLIGFLFVIGGAALGLYIGGWLMLVGGIVQIVEACKASPIESWGIAIGVARVVLASFVGWATFAIGVLIGNVLESFD